LPPSALRGWGGPPDLAIGITRQTVPYLRAIKRASQGRTFTIFLQNPRCPLDWFDLVWAPLHDGLSGPNVITTPTAPHRMSPTRLHEAAVALEPKLRDLPGPRIAVLIGGPNKEFKFGADQAQDLTQRLDALTRDGSFLITTSRRTPPDVVALVSFWASTRKALIWRGADDGPNPFLGFMGAADAIVVSADSINMATEAVSTGKPVYVFDLPGEGGKFKTFHRALYAAGATRPLTGSYAPWVYSPIDANPVIAAAILERYHARQSSNAARA
jgi:mitochondrial fission protein ELM1